VTTEAPKNTERILFLLKIEKAERAPRGLTATEGGHTASYYNLRSLTTTEAGQTTSTSNGRKISNFIAITLLAIWPRVALWSDREVRRIISTASFWSVGYKYSSNSCKT
jgi:hypothetical protein